MNNGPNEMLCVVCGDGSSLKVSRESPSSGVCDETVENPLLDATNLGGARSTPQ